MAVATSSSKPKKSKKAQKKTFSPAEYRQKQIDKLTVQLGIDSQILLLPTRRQQPQEVVLHIGPTNSGKTYAAFQALKAAKAGIYASPLRFLAREAYETLAADLGEDMVGMVTGEEQINPQAPIICCTAEMAPREGNLLILDESHWVADEQRGTAWTRLLCGGEYRSMHLIASSDAQNILLQAFPDAEIKQYERLNPLTFDGKININNVPDGSALIAFSRKEVLALASILHKQGKQVATLYGNMPLEARHLELQRFTNGEATILCSTDVVGHGVNIPTLRSIIFAQTNKFDGQTRRNLHKWEVAQIAGRAGRYGHVEEGKVYCLSGVKWAQPNPALVKESLQPPLEIEVGVYGYRNISQAYISPKLEDLNCYQSADIGRALKLWQLLIEDQDMPAWIQIDRCQTQRELFQFLQQTQQQKYLQVEEMWKLINAPVDTRNPQILQMFVSWLRHYHDPQSNTKPVLPHDLRPQYLKHSNLEDTESFTTKMSVLRWFTYNYPDASPVNQQQILEAEQQAAQRVSKLLAATIQEGNIGCCTECGEQCAPWFHHCDSCHQKMYNRYDYWD